MANRTGIDGTGYNIKGGRTLIEGTSYAIKKGRTLIGGTGYDIKFDKYKIDTWRGVDGDENVTNLSRSWSDIRKGQDVSHAITANISSNTNVRPISGFLLSGLNAGDNIEVTFSASTTASGSFYINAAMQFLGSGNSLYDGTPDISRQTVTGIATTGDSLLIIISVGRYCRYTYTTTLTIHSLKVNGEQII